MRLKNRAKATVLVVDKDGRADALVTAYLKSPLVERVIAIPGNDYMLRHGLDEVRTYPHLSTTSVEEIIAIATEEQVILADVAQDNAVEAGVADSLRSLVPKIAVVGPSRAAGEIEWNKGFLREQGKDWKLPQPDFQVFDNITSARQYLLSQPEKPRYIKYAQLFAGKGALSAKDTKQALFRLEQTEEIISKQGGSVVIEDWLLNDDGTLGEEFSTFALSDGTTYQLLGHAQDYKRAKDGDKGEQTGSMGSNAPTSGVSDEDEAIVQKSMIKPIINGLKLLQRPYVGILYVSWIKVTQRGKIYRYIIETNSRWGDPEAQVIIPSLKNDFFVLNMAATNGSLSGITVDHDDNWRVAITGTAKGYPGDYRQVIGKEISGLESMNGVPGITLYGAGIKKLEDNYVVNGGRVFYVVSEGQNIKSAQKKALLAMKQLHIEGDNLVFRTDIGWRDSKRT